MSQEHWKYIPGFDLHYAVSTHGRVISMRYGRLLKPFLEGGKIRPSKKYLIVEFSYHGLEQKFLVHQLVLTVFRGPRPPDMESRHLDGNKFNNRLSNLVWGTQRKNNEDRRKHGKGMKLNPIRVRYIRRSPMSLRALAKELGCSKSLVALVRKRRLWRDIA